MRTNFKKVGRRFKNTVKKVGTIIRRGASVAKTILGTIDNFSGGAVSARLQSDPRGALALGLVNNLADRDRRITERGERKYRE
jgi:hypothetical protein